MFSPYIPAVSHSLVSEHKLNTGHLCSIKDVNILDLEENWHRINMKEAIIIHREAGFKQRHWSRTPTSHAPACVT